MEVEILSYGGIVKSICVPDKRGQQGDVTLGFDSLEGYLGEHPFFGVIIGRYGNRIAKGQFTINNTSYQLPINNGPNTLHGGIQGFDKVLWKTQAIPNGVQLQYLSKDKEEGFPGNLAVQVSYTLDNHNALTIHYEATTDQPTVCNLTNHTYFNLGGTDHILDHYLLIDADYITPVDDALIPLGSFRLIDGTAFDFRTFKQIRKDIKREFDEQIRLGSGYDHNFVLKNDRKESDVIAKVFEPTSGRLMSVYTSEPGVQLYTANTIANIIGKGGAIYNGNCGLCLETQHFPDSPNQSTFPSTLLLPSEKYESTTVYQFSINE